MRALQFALVMLVGTLLAAPLAPARSSSSPWSASQTSALLSSNSTGESPCDINLTNGQFSSQWANASAGAITGPSLFPNGSNNSERDILWGKVCNSPSWIFFAVGLQAEPTNASWYRIWIDTTGSGVRDYDLVFATWGLEVWNFSTTLYTCYLGPGPVCDRQLPAGCTCWEVGVPLSLLGDPSSLRYRADARTNTDVLVDTVPTPPAWSPVYYLRPLPAKAAAPLWENPVVIVAGSVFAGSAILAVFVATSEAWRYGFLVLPPALYARLGKTKALDHFLRGRIYQSIQEHPGITYTELKNSVGVANGVLTYHLHYLEMAGFLRSRRDRKWKQFYAADAPMVQGDRYLSLVQKRLVEACRDEPGQGYSQIAHRIGVTKWQVMYNAKRLAEDRLLVLQRKGISVHCFPGTAPLVSKVPQTSAGTPVPGQAAAAAPKPTTAPGTPGGVAASGGSRSPPSGPD